MKQDEVFQGQYVIVNNEDEWEFGGVQTFPISADELPPAAYASPVVLDHLYWSKAIEHFDKVMRPHCRRRSDFFKWAAQMIAERSAPKEKPE